VTLADMVAVVLFLVITAYAVFGGADFGAGLWDLVAGGAHRGEGPRGVMEHAIGPVWEANHVWLIFTLVILWTAFPAAFAAIMLTMFVPLSIAALGIVLRGAGFALRKAVPDIAEQRIYGAAFAASSVIVPFCLGAVVGGVVAGDVPPGGEAGDPWSSWTGPSSIVGGLLAVTVCAYLAAVFLTSDARRLGEEGLVGYFRRRAIGSAFVAGVLALVGVVVLHDDAHQLYENLVGRALPLVVLSTIAGLVALLLLFRRADHAARLAGAVAVAAVVLGWGIAQWPYLLPTSTTVEEAAAPHATLVALAVVTVAAVVIVVPALVWLFVLDQANRLEARTAPPAGADLVEG
jgi:cytochrome d ubiquinol oxidase subunit II